jgi:adenine-specific DNA-methyltransferase
MNPKYEKLKRLLKELFQLDQPDLDFGLYRVMHARSGEITQFLDRELLPQVKEAFSLYRTADKAEIEKQLREKSAQYRADGLDPDSVPGIQKLRDQLAQAVDLSALENEIYDHLFSFFRRYYNEGDFLSLRRYKEGVYAIPYEGEEVKLHWANADQYYIKTSEYLRDYAFRLRPEDAQNAMRVHFRLVDATEGEHGNVKAAEGKDRVFILTDTDFVVEEGGELLIRFEYRPARLSDWGEGESGSQGEGEKNKPPAQKDLIAIAAQRILTLSSPHSVTLTTWLRELARPHVKADGEKAEYTRLEAHLRRYSARNTFDYFIHKDLGGFLRRELDFYIKNEVMRLDDIESEIAPRVEQYLSKIEVLRRIAGKIIEFLAQLEDFQKKLWLKKKFVVETTYCVTAGSVPEQFYAEIVANEAQLDEWRSLLALETVMAETPLLSHGGINADTLRRYPTLMVDTRHFSADFTARLLHALGDLDEQTDGVLFHSENFQTLTLMQTRYREQVKCIYIDPPYNTDASAIDYKNGYKASSWVSLIEGRVSQSRNLLIEDGVLIAAIDDEQQRELNFILSQVFGDLLGTICVRSNPSGRPTQTGYSVSHEYLLFAGKSSTSAIGRMPPTEAQMSRFSHQDEEGKFEWRNLRREGSNSDRSARPALYYPIYLQGNNIRVPKLSWTDESKEWVIKEELLEGELIVWPDNEAGEQKTWRWEWSTVMKSLQSLSVRQDRSGRDYIYYKRRPNEDGVVSVSSWFDAKYSATEHGTAVLKALFGYTSFSYPKSIHAVVDSIYIGGASKEKTATLDFFAGSGSTGHAVINLNREDNGQRKFILVEMGKHFDTVLLPRLKKVTFTPEWRDGKPLRLATPEEAARSPRLFKVLRLESYEDTLNNLQPHRTPAQQSLLVDPEAQGANGLREQYLLRYLLDVETRGSQSLLNIQAFNDPTAYKLLVKTSGSDESRAVNVDLLETFNWLIGLTVRHIAAPQTFTAAFQRDNEGRLRLDGQLKADSAGPHWFRAVTGVTPDGRETLIIWRKLTGNVEEDNLVLDEWFTRQGYSGKESEFDLIYVNGGNNLENLKTLGNTWTVRLIEADFHHLMFDMEGL